MSDVFIKYSNLSNSELKAVAALHSESIDHGFLSQLGYGFLYYLYRSLSECDNSVLVIAKKGDDVVGFVSGTIDLSAVYTISLGIILLVSSLFYRPIYFLLVK